MAAGGEGHLMDGTATDRPTVQGVPEVIIVFGQLQILRIET